MRLQSLVRASGLAALACALGCGHEGPTGPTISLSQAEVVTLADEVGDLMPTPLVDAPGPINATAACPGGGNISAAGSVGATNTTVTLDMTYTFTSCKSAHYTVSGPLRVRGSASSTATELSLQARFTGTVAVGTSDGRSGNCGVDFTVSTTVGQSTANPTYTISGSACGVNVSGTR
jgi:hypothetical protein